MEYTTEYQFCSGYLLPDEHVVWRGRPEKGNYLAPADLLTIPFSIFFLAFSLFWEFSVMNSGILFMSLWGLPFVAVGLYLSIGRFLHAAYMRDKTFYVITNKKLIIKKGSHITIYTRNDLPPMTLYMHKNGNGTIRFTETYYRRGRHRTTSFALENIQNPVHAQNAINLME